MAASEPITDLDLTDSHRRHRERRARHTIVASLASRCVNYGARLVIIPLSIRLLGADQYGLWLAVGSVVAWLGLSDLGLSSGLLNTVAGDLAEEAPGLTRQHISTGIVSYAFLSLVVMALLIPASHWGGIESLLGVTGNPSMTRDARLLVMICAFFYAASFSAHGVNTICQALQEGYLGAYSQITGNVIGLVALAVLYWKGGTLIQFAVVMAVPPLLASAGLAVYLFWYEHPELRPRWRLWNRRSFRSLIGFGGPLFAVQVANLAILYSSNLLIADRLGPKEVARYAVPYSLFVVAAGACSTLADPYLAAFVEASKRGDWNWVRQTAIRMLMITVTLMATANAFFLVAGRRAIRWWAGPDVVPSGSFLLAMSLFFLAMTWTNTTGVFLVGLGKVKTKAVLNVLVATIFVGGIWALLPSWGIMAVPIVGASAHLVDLILSLPLALKHIRDESARQHADGGSGSFSQV